MRENELVDSGGEKRGQQESGRGPAGALILRSARAGAVRQSGAGNGDRLVTAPLGVDPHSKVLRADRVADPRFAEIDAEGPEVETFAIAPSHSTQVVVFATI